MKSKAFWLRICVLLTVLVMVGCGPQLRKWYEAPTLPEDRIAFLTHKGVVSIVSLDGKPKGSGGGRWTYVELLPGAHSVSIKYYKKTEFKKIWSPKPINLTFDAKAGHIYAIEYATNVSILSPGSGYWKAWIEDVTTNPVFQKDLKNLDRRPDPNLTEAEIYCRRGLAYAYKGRYDRALVDLNKSVELTPKAALPYINRAKAYNGKGLYDHAISDCDKAIEIMPRSFMAFHNRGVAFLGKGFYDEAISDFNKAVEINPKYVLAYRNKGDAYLQKGMYESAISDFTDAIRMDKRNAYTYHKRGVAYDRKGLYKRAVSDCDKAIKIDPSFAEAYDLRGTISTTKLGSPWGCADLRRACQLGICMNYKRICGE